MPARDWKFRIEDIMEALQDILEGTRDMTFEAFCRDTKSRKAVLYNLAVIGEAARMLPEEIIDGIPTSPGGKWETCATWLSMNTSGLI